MKDIGTDPKQKAILKSAWTAFASYGFRKTSMDDIARGAGMSRPALYLHYRNKEDIFRSLAQFYYDDAVQSVAEALSAEGPIPDTLARAFAAQGGLLNELIWLHVQICRRLVEHKHLARGQELLAGLPGAQADPFA